MSDLQRPHGLQPTRLFVHEMFQYSCLENPMDGGAWWSTVHGVAKNQILLSDLTNLKVKKDYESTHKNDLFFSFIMNYLTKG